MALAYNLVMDVEKVLAYDFFRFVSCPLMGLPLRRLSNAGRYVYREVLVALKGSSIVNIFIFLLKIYVFMKLF